MKPFANESDALGIGADLTIENRIDRVSLYGSVDLTWDKAGLVLARELLKVLQDTVNALEAAPDLPDALPVKPARKVANPFQ